MSLPNFAIKFAMEIAGRAVGGPVGAAIAAIGATGAFAVVEVGNLVNRTNSALPVRLSDVAAATAAVEAALYAAGVYGTAVGSTAVVAPGAIAGVLILAVGVAATYYKNEAASLDALETFWNTLDRSKPWEAAARAVRAYSAEIERQKEVDAAANTKFNDARNFVPRYDPLVLDLDGDGLELVGASGSILFDHNADGIKTGTGWARPDDGFLVRDLNGNGQIDTGRELFGVDTIKSNGGLAIDGFDALRDIDTNGDGFITNADAAYADLRVWRDLDQNGTSTANELFTLAGLGITSIRTNGTSTGPQAGQIVNNNLIALSTTYIRNGVTRTVGAIDLEANNFFTEFPPQVVDEAGNPVAITAQAQALPQMNGAGMVRNMHAAASLSGDFAAALTSFAAGTTRACNRTSRSIEFKYQGKPYIGFRCKRKNITSQKLSNTGDL